MSTDTSRRPDMFMERVYPHLSGSHFFTFFCQNSDSLDNRVFRSTQAHSPRNHRFTFTGKEWCKSLWLAQRRFVHGFSETGYSYFGARYYDSDLSSLFLSIDPMADKYPGLSPYAYCSWNPVKLVDPDGREKIPAFNINVANRDARKNERYLQSWARSYTRNQGFIHLFAHGINSEGVNKGLFAYLNGTENNIRSVGELRDFLMNNSVIFRNHNKEGEASQTSILVMHCCSTGRGYQINYVKYSKKNG